MIKFFFKTCPKTGRIRGWRKDTIYHKVLFPMVGLAALIWVIIRVVPKPSRAAYPCQQAAIPMAGAFLTWLAGSTIGVYLIRKSKGLFSKKLVYRGLMIASTGVILFFGAQFIFNTTGWADEITATKSPFFFGPNKPIGKAQGIHPGRVTWIRNADVALWDGKTGQWWNEGNIDEKILADMYSKSIRGVAGVKNDSLAWDKIFRYFNKKHGKGNLSWKPGELIVVKININNTYTTNDTDNDIDQSPQATRALLHQLIDVAGIHPEDIMIYDASVGWKVRALPDRIFVPLHKEFPKVRWMDGQGINGRENPEWVANAISYSSNVVELGTELPKAVVDAAYLINVALFKGHEISGVTLCAKNHFGTIRYPQKDHGKYVSQMSGKPGDYNAYVDLMGSPNLGGKTLLYIVDGIYGMQTNVGQPNADRDKFHRLFNNEWSASYFMSQDPVAIESVCLDFLWSEFRGELGYSGAPWFPKGSSKNCDNYLIEAAKGTNAKFGPYKPNGVIIGSLGVHEHWNNATDKKYSRNLGKNQGIELLKLN